MKDIRMLRKLRRCRDGSIATEFAVVLPVLMMMLVGIIEFSLMLFTYNSMQQAAHQVTRQLALNVVGTDAAEPMLAGRIPAWGRDGVEVEVTTAGLGANTVIGVRATLPASRATPVPFVVNAIGDWMLVTEVQMVQELPFLELPN